MAITLQTNARNAAVDGIAPLHNSGTLEIKSAASTVAGTSEVATVTFGATAFAAASGGSASANAITDDSSATGGTAGFFTTFTSGAAAIMQGVVSTSGADLNLSSVSIGASDIVSISSFTLTQPAS